MANIKLYNTWFTCCLLAIGLGYSSCKPKPKPVAARLVKKQINFKGVIGISFTEARRVFDNGLSFEPHGFYQEPNWKVTFLPGDSVSIYSPTKKKFVTAPVVLDHDSVVSVAWAWLRVKKLSKDSIVFQVLKVQNNEIYQGKPYVFMKLYANSYITDSLHTSAAALEKPNHADTAFIKNLAIQSNRDITKAFAATQPVILTSRSPRLTVSKRAVKPDLATGAIAEDAYYSPTYDINIRQAFDDFNYSFAATVDEKGHVTFVRSLDQSYDADFEKYIIRNIKGIISGYLKYYMQVIPGKTLNIPHASTIVLNVNGTKN